MPSFDISSAVNKVLAEIKDKEQALEVVAKGLREEKDNILKKERKVLQREKDAAARELKIQRDFEELNRKQNAKEMEEKAAIRAAGADEKIARANTLLKKAEEKMDEVKQLEERTREQLEQLQAKARELEEKADEKINQIIVDKVLGK